MKQIFTTLLLTLVCVANAQQLTIVTSNTENLINTYDDYSTKLPIVAQMMADKNADIYCLQEVQPVKSTVNELMTALNKVSSTNYVAINLFDNENYYHQSLYVYNASTVKPVGDSYSPYTSSLYSMRLRIQEFSQLSNGETFLLSNNHFKSFNEDKTLENAQKLVATLSTASEPRIMIVGDLNSYLTHDPCQYIVNAGYIEEVESRYPNGYSYYYSGSYEYIDHCFTSKDMSECVVDAAPWNINVGSKAQYGYSDHDPLVMTIQLAKDTTEPEDTTTVTPDEPTPDVTPTDSTKTDDDKTDTGITTDENTLTVSEAYDICNQMENKVVGETYYNVKGIVDAVSEISTQYGNATFTFTDGVETMKAYRVMGLDSTAISTDDYVSVGDTVIVRGPLEKYGTTMEVYRGYIKELHHPVTDNPVDAIVTTCTDTDETGIFYTLQGIRTDARRPGLYIKKTRNGSRKVLR